MKWECPPTSRNNLCSSSEATVAGKQEEEEAQDADGDEGETVESCALPPCRASLDLYWIGLIGLCICTCGLRSATARSFSVFPPLSAVHRCANVCARSTARKDKEERRHSAVRSPATVVHSKFFAEICIRFLKSLLRELRVLSGFPHTFAPKNAASGAHRWVRTARCQRSQPERSKLAIRLHNWTPKISQVRFARSPSGLPASRRCAAFDSRGDGFVCTVVLGGEEGTRAGLRRLSFPLHA